MKPHIAGPVVGLVMAAVMAALFALLGFSGDSIGAVYLAAAGGMFVVGPLAVANLILSIVYWRRQAPARTYLWMWGSPLAVLLAVAVIASVHDGIRAGRERSFEMSHPNIREVHVNLSGRSLWLDPESTVNDSKGAVELPADKPAQFVAFTRYAKPYYGEDRMLAYTGARLAADFREMSVFYGKPDGTPPTMLPVVVRPEAFPDTASFLDKLSFKGGESAVLQYWYYHYPDRIEVVPALDLAGSQSMDLWGTNAPVAGFRLANLTSRPIARLEIDGQALALGEDAVFPETGDGSTCSARNYVTHAVNRLGAPLKVRWQFAQPNAPWQEAVVTVPSFKSGQAPRGRARGSSIELYFQADGSVVAERSQEIDLPGDNFALRTTGPVPALRQAPPCGLAPDRYSEQAVIIRD